MSGKRLKERLARATSRRAMKLQREMFERWRMEAREKRKEREESRGVEREVNELNERMEALQKQFVKEKEQWKEEETRIANAHEAKLEEFTKANENEKLRVATERASRDAETKQKFEAEIALLKLKEEQGRKTYEERKERLIERAVGAMEVQTLPALYGFKATSLNCSVAMFLPINPAKGCPHKLSVRRTTGRLYLRQLAGH